MLNTKVNKIYSLHLYLNLIERMKVSKYLLEESQFHHPKLILNDAKRQDEVSTHTLKPIFLLLIFMHLYS